MLSFDGSIKVAKFEKNVKVGDETKDMEVARLWIAPRDGQKRPVACQQSVWQEVTFTDNYFIHK